MCLYYRDPQRIVPWWPSYPFVTLACFSMPVRHLGDAAPGGRPARLAGLIARGWGDVKAPFTTITTEARAASEMMCAERQQENDGDWHADQPEQDGTHDIRLLLARSGGTMVRRRNGSAYSSPGAVPGSASCSRLPSNAARSMITAA